MLVLVMVLCLHWHSGHTAEHNKYKCNILCFLSAEILRVEMPRTGETGNINWKLWILLFEGWIQSVRRSSGRGYWKFLPSSVLTV